MGVELIPITRDGFEKIKKELERLQRVERPKIVAEIEKARALGDLSENAEYHCAKERQGFIECQIGEMQERMSRAQIVDISKLSGSKVMFGATVRILDTNTEEELQYQLVGPLESDVQAGKISIASPIGKALIGKEIGEVVKVRLPKGEREFEILDVIYK